MDFDVLIGGGLAILGGFLAQMKAHHDTKKLEREKLISYLLAIRAELETTWEVYMKDVGKMIEDYKEGGQLFFHWRVEADYFSIYHSNAHLIGSVTDDTLRKNIVETYTLAKSHLDSWTVNNELLSDHIKAAEDFRLNQDGELSKHYKDWHAETRFRLTSYTNVIKQSHDILKQRIETLLPMLTRKQLEKLV